MKKLISLLQLLFIIVIANAQCSWQYSSDRIYPLNNAGSAFSPYVKIGLGTNNPTAQFHTVSTVRFAGIANNIAPKRFIVSDSLGNLGWQDVAVLDNYWKKGGNIISNANTEYFGSSNYSDVVFKSNNIRRVIISKDGAIGIGDILIPYNSIDIKKNGNSIVQSVADGGESIIKLEGTGNGAYLSTLQLNEYNAQNSWYISIKKDINNPNAKRQLAFDVIKNGTLLQQSVMEVSNTNKVFFGIGTTSPTARLHVVDSVRFQNLPSGTGNVLVIDAAGNVMRSTQTAAKTTNPKTEQLEARVALLENEIA